MLWAGLSAWFGYRKFRGKAFRLAVVGPLLALFGAFVGASIAGLIKGVNPFDWLHDSALLRHVVTGALVFGFLYTFIVALIANLRNREYRALTANLEAEARQSELSRQLAESKLKLLQLQIEPHFLFNTLGSAQQLAEKGCARRRTADQRPHPFPARVHADAARRGDHGEAGRSDDPRVPSHHADAAGCTAPVVGRHSRGPGGRGVAARHADHARGECDQARHRAACRRAAAST